MAGELRLGEWRADDGNVSLCGSPVKGSGFRHRRMSGCQDARQEIKAEVLMGHHNTFEVMLCAKKPSATHSEAGLMFFSSTVSSRP